MALEVGSVVEGKVTSLAKFGAFIALPGGKSGLVHISEVAATFVSDVHDHLQVGQSVKVRVLSISEDGKINLSIKRAQEPAPAPAQQRRFDRETAPRAPRPACAPVPPAAPKSENQEFEDKLKKFMQESDSRIADNPFYADRPRKNNRRK